MEAKEIKVLEELTQGVSARELKRGKLHEVFEPSFDWKECTHNLAQVLGGARECAGLVPTTGQRVNEQMKK